MSSHWKESTNQPLVNLWKYLWVQPAFTAEFSTKEREAAEARIKKAVVRAIQHQAKKYLVDPNVDKLISGSRQIAGKDDPTPFIASVVAGPSGKIGPSIYYHGTDLGTILSDPVVRNQARLWREKPLFVMSNPIYQVLLQEYGKLLPGAFYLVKLYAKVQQEEGEEFMITDVQTPVSVLDYSFLRRLLPLRGYAPVYGLVASVDRRALLLPEQRKLVSSYNQGGLLPNLLSTLAGKRGLFADRTVVTTPLYDA